MLKKKYLLFFILFLLGFFLCTSCLPKPPLTEGILKGQVIVPEGTIKAKDLTGQSLPDATVNIIDPLTGNILATTTTDANGYYQVFVPAGGPYLLEAIKDGIKLQQFTPPIEVGLEYDLGTADCGTTSVALIAQAMMDTGDNPTNINLTAIQTDPNFNAVSNIVCSIIEDGGDPTESALVQQAIEDFLNPPAHVSTPTPTYTVNFDSNSGTAVSPITDIAYNTTVNLPTAPTKALNTFAGWFSDNTTFLVPFTASTPVIANITVYAKWTASCFDFDSTTGTITGYTCSERDVVIPPTIDATAVVAIDNQVFYMKNLTSILIPEGMISIGNAAFIANQLTSVTIPNSVTSIGIEAFNSNLLQSLTIGSGLTNIPNSAFSYNELTSVTIPNNVTSIGGWAFAQNHLTSVTISSKVTNIPYYAFYGPENKINQITIGAGVIIDSDAATMGTNPGFQDAYIAGGNLAGTYNYVGTWVNRALVVGDSYGGGKIAYIFVSGDIGYEAGETHGLIAATTDLKDDSGEEITVEWSNIDDVEIGPDAQGTAIGTGQANTTRIVTQTVDAVTCTSGAAYLCYNLDEGGYYDWYLPSKDELNKLWENRDAIGGFNEDFSYWSSSEYDASGAWGQYFDIGFQGYSIKNDLDSRVRAVRAF